MAASNADFWTSRGWDGSEAMIGKGRAYCIKLPSTSRATLLSSSSVKTLIVTLQGAQAIYTLIRGLKTGTYAYTISIDSIFFPLAVFGLLRLSAALWLTDDYHYAELEDLETITTSSLEASTSVSRLAPFLEVQSKASTGLLEFSDTSSGEYFHPTKSWRGVLYRFFFLLPILGLWTICSLYVLPWNIRRTFSATSFVLVLFYLFFLSATIIIFAFYFIGGRSATTIIPCITSIWYKIYTFVLLSFMLILVVIAALETRKTACGQYTTFAPSVDDEVLCPGFVPIISNSTILPFGLATFGPVGKDNETSTGGEIKVLNWDGWCQGTGQVIQIVVPVNTTIVN
jgi:hypothetical protein